MKTILIIEDEEICHQLIRGSLEDNGYEILSALDSKEGIEKASAAAPDLIIIDIGMPGLDGIEVTQRLRTDKRFCTTPIIVLSGSTKLQSKLNAFNAGADDFLGKPFASEELSARVSRLLQKAESSKTRASASSGKVICVQGMRGGAGCSSVAVNLAITLQNLWNTKTLLVDSRAEGGHLDLFLDGAGGITWGDLPSLKSESLDSYVTERILQTHRTKIQYLSSPSLQENVGHEVKSTLIEAIEFLRNDFDYIVVDLGTSCDSYNRKLLSESEAILCVVSPDLASLETTMAMLRRYEELNIDSESIQLIVNHVYGKYGFSMESVEKALSRPVNYHIEFAPGLFHKAVNSGLPFAADSSDRSNVISQFVQIAFGLSKDCHVNVPPPVPTATWLKLVQTNKDSSFRNLFSFFGSSRSSGQ